MDRQTQLEVASFTYLIYKNLYYLDTLAPISFSDIRWLDELQGKLSLDNSCKNPEKSCKNPIFCINMQKTFQKILSQSLGNLYSIMFMLGNLPLTDHQTSLSCSRIARFLPQIELTCLNYLLHCKNACSVSP